MSATPFTGLNTLAAHLRQELETKKYILLYAYPPWSPQNRPFMVTSKPAIN